MSISIPLFTAVLMIIEIFLAIHIGNLVYQYRIERTTKKMLKNKQGKEENK